MAKKPTKKIEVLLRQPYGKNGMPGDVIEVAPGLARNRLIPQGIAEAVNDNNRSEVTAPENTDNIRRSYETQKEAHEALSQFVSNLDLRYVREANNNGKLFGSVTSQEIAEEINIQLHRADFDVRSALKKAEISFSKKHVQPRTKIETIGAHLVNVAVPDFNFSMNVVAGVGHTEGVAEKFAKYRKLYNQLSSDEGSAVAYDFQDRYKEIQGSTVAFVKPAQESFSVTKNNVVQAFRNEGVWMYSEEIGVPTITSHTIADADYKQYGFKQKFQVSVYTTPDKAITDLSQRAIPQAMSQRSMF